MMVGSTRNRAYSQEQNNLATKKRKYTKRKNTQANEPNNVEAFESSNTQVNELNNSLHLELQESIQNENDVTLIFDEYDRIVPSNRVISEDEDEVVAEEVVDVQKKGIKRKRGESLKGINIFIIIKIIIFMYLDICF